MSEAQNRDTTLRALDSLRLRLLDLTARNRLINFRHTKRGSLRLVGGLPDQLVEALLDDAELRFLSIPEPTTGELIEAGFLEIDRETGQETRLQKGPTAEEWARLSGWNTSYQSPERLVKTGDGGTVNTNNTLQTLLYPHELEARLRGLMHMAESAIQEMGANILYLAFGALEWHETSGESRLAPLFLVPVRLRKGRLNRKTSSYEYTLKYSGEDIIPNLSLREKLRVDFALALPGLDENTSPESYFAEISSIIGQNQPRWRLHRTITLTVLNFSSLLMYLDLNPDRWPDKANMTSHPLIRRFLAGYRPGQSAKEVSNTDFGFGEEHPIDELDNVHTRYPLIDDADSSQHSALIDAIDGKNLVIEGPPGTGKSQTITNVIAAALAQGKRVLFVAEKLAALEVVRRRLDAAGLGDFCLELHSHKSEKRRVLDDIAARLNKHGHYRPPRDIEVALTRYEELKTALKGYVEQVNRTWKSTGMTVHEIFMAAARYREVLGINPISFHPEDHDGSSLDGITQRRLIDQVEAYRTVSQAVVRHIEDSPEWPHHPWYGVGNPSLQVFDRDLVRSTLENWQKTLRDLSGERPGLAETLRCVLEEVPDSLDGLCRLIDDLAGMPPLGGSELLDRLPVLRGEALHEARRYLELFEDIQAQYAELSQTIGLEILQDLSQVDALVAGGEQLSRLANPSVELRELAEAADRLRSLKTRLEELDEPLKGIREALGDAAAPLLFPSEDGIGELITLVDLVTELPPAYWELRHERFDNEELDTVLPELRRELTELRGLKDELQEAFRVEALPGHHELRLLRTTIASGGIFGRFKGSWRAARKTVLDLAVDSRVGFARLRLLLGKAEDFSRKHRELADNHRYRELLGEHLRGLDTDLPALETLRGWYRKVRRQYGFGFGRTVGLGNALIPLPVDTARGIRLWSDRGLAGQAGAALDTLQNLKVIFEPVSELKNGRVELIGEQGLVEHIISALDEAVNACRPLITAGTMTTGELIDRTRRLDRLNKAVQEWETADTGFTLFQGWLGLKPAVSTDNTAPLSRLQSTLAMADWVDRHLRNDQVRRLIYDQPDVAVFHQLTALADRLRDLVETQAGNYREFAGVVHLEPEHWSTACGDRLDRLMARNDWALDHDGTLPNWLDLLRVQEQINRAGLSGLVTAVERGDIQIEQAEDACRAGLFDLLAREILSEQPELGQFSGHNQEALRKQFQHYDNRLKTLQRVNMAWQADQVTIPTGTLGARVSEHTELCLLKHEISKKMRHIPIRQLLRRAGGALTTLKPCFMMGPMSVAQYLAPGQIEFDLIIMDEASQIKPQDALGAVARGAQLVVVGDPKQLPPTSFFDRVIQDGEDDLTALEESESILDAALSMFQARRLRWHYRSRHESLIAFSNHSFYDNDLVLFPSPHREIDHYGIQYTRVAHGCFVNRRNLEEARIIAEAVREHLKQRPEESLGVAAISAEQRLQIENAVEALSKEDSVFQQRLEEDAAREEPLFIKNLENVQGDERDVIYISLTYGPQKPGGRVFQRFGPINQDTGWRRLNVLFTRSRQRMHIFSSMSSSDITTGPASSRGVQALRDFLAFCETGVLPQDARDAGRAPQSDFEVSFTRALRDIGLDGLSRVGAAGFFIDVAVFDPGNRGSYLMGIEGDGATYHAAKSTRDRDRLRQAVLERLGWRIRRVWSTDWFRHPQAQLQPILRELESLKAGAPVGLEGQADSEAAQIAMITARVEHEEGVVEAVVQGKKGLREKLLRFDGKVIREAMPHTPDHQRLLRPAMLEALLEHQPAGTAEYLEYIPGYLRQATNPREEQYLEPVLKIISENSDEPTK